MIKQVEANRILALNRARALKAWEARRANAAKAAAPPPAPPAPTPVKQPEQKFDSHDSARRRQAIFERNQARAQKAWIKRRANMGLAPKAAGPPTVGLRFTVLEAKSPCAPNTAEGIKYQKDGENLYGRFRGVPGGPKALRAWARQRDYEYLGAGISRVGVALMRKPTCVVKFAYAKVGFDDGLHGNRKEIDDYKALPQDAKDLFAPIIAYSNKNNWILLPRVKTFKEFWRGGDKGVDVKVGNKSVHVTDNGDAGNALNQALAEHGLEIGDLHDSNLAVTSDNRLVVLDWGFGINHVHPAAVLDPAINAQWERRRGETTDHWKQRIDKVMLNKPDGVKNSDLFRPHGEAHTAWVDRVNKLVPPLVPAPAPVAK